MANLVTLRWLIKTLFIVLLNYSKMTTDMPILNMLTTIYLTTNYATYNKHQIVFINHELHSNFAIRGEQQGCSQFFGKTSGAGGFLSLVPKVDDSQGTTEHRGGGVICRTFSAIFQDSNIMYRWSRGLLCFFLFFLLDYDDRLRSRP